MNVNFKIARSDAQDAIAAVKHLKEQLTGIEACFVLYFASPGYSPETIAKEMAGAFPGAYTVGCSTAGEMISGKPGKNSIAAMAWGRSTLKYLKIEVLEHIKTDPQAVAKAFKSFEASTGVPMNQLNPSRYAGLVMIDGLSGCEEYINDQIGNMTNVPFVGGSAGDDFMFTGTWLYVDGKAYTDAAVLVLLEPTNGYAILKTQSFGTTDKKLTPTKVDEKRRMVIEFDGRPATEAYAEALGVSADNLAEHLGEHPVGLVFDEHNFFVRSPQQIEDTSIIFYCAVKEGMELTLLQSGDIVTDTRNDLRKAEQENGGLQAVVDFNCCLRALELDRKNQMQAYSDIFANIPAVGFATYGESYIGHINQTSTMLLLK